MCLALCIEEAGRLALSAPGDDANAFDYIPCPQISGGKTCGMPICAFGEPDHGQRIFRCSNGHELTLEELGGPHWMAGRTLAPLCCSECGELSPWIPYGINIEGGPALICKECGHEIFLRGNGEWYRLPKPMPRI